MRGETSTLMIKTHKTPAKYAANRDMTLLKLLEISKFSSKSYLKGDSMSNFKKDCFAQKIILNPKSPNSYLLPATRKRIVTVHLMLPTTSAPCLKSAASKKKFDD